MNEAQLTQVATSWVTRARSGDQVAMAALKKAGAVARSGRATPEQRFVYQAAKRYIETHPVGKLSRAARKLGAPPEMAAEATLVGVDPVTVLRKKRSDDRRPTLPRGALADVFNPGKFQAAILSAVPYRDGMSACVVVLAAGPPLTPAVCGEIGASQFPSPAALQAFMHGVQFCGERDWEEAAPGLPSDLRSCMLIGQCLGRVCRLQALRQGGAISDYDPTIGWELGE